MLASPDADAAAAAPGAAPLLDAFLELQRERAAAYSRLDSAFRAYLQDGAEGPYRRVCTGAGQAVGLDTAMPAEAGPAPAAAARLPLF